MNYFCKNVYKSGEITPDNDEIDDAQWFEVDNLPNTPPPGVSISGDLIQHFLNSLK